MGEMDKDLEGGINFRDFVKLMAAEPPGARETSREHKKVFMKYDRGNKHYIDVEDIKFAAKQLGEYLAYDEAQAIVNKCSSK